MESTKTYPDTQELVSIAIKEYGMTQKEISVLCGVVPSKVTDWKQGNLKAKYKKIKPLLEKIGPIDRKKGTLYEFAVEYPLVLENQDEFFDSLSKKILEKHYGKEVKWPLFGSSFGPLANPEIRESNERFEESLWKHGISITNIPADALYAGLTEDAAKSKIDLMIQSFKEQIEKIGFLCYFPPSLKILKDILNLGKDWEDKFAWALEESLSFFHLSEVTDDTSYADILRQYFKKDEPVYKDLVEESLFHILNEKSFLKQISVKGKVLWEYENSVSSRKSYLKENKFDARKSSLAFAMCADNFLLPKYHNLLSPEKRYNSLFDDPLAARPMGEREMPFHANNIGSLAFRNETRDRLIIHGLRNNAFALVLKQEFREKESSGKSQWISTIMAPLNYDQLIERVNEICRNIMLLPQSCLDSSIQRTLVEEGYPVSGVKTIE